MDVERTIAQCRDIIFERRNGRHAFVSGLSKSCPPERLARWAVQKYHQVYRQNAVFSNIHANSFAPDVRRWMVDQLIAEETPLESGSASHFDLMRRFALRCGAREDDFMEDGMGAPVRQHVDLLLATTRREHFAIGLLAIYAIEAQSAESVGKLLAVLRNAYDFSDHDLEWFTVHCAEEDDHADIGVNLVHKYAGEVADFDARAPRVVSEICDSWLRLHDYYYSIITH